jgi:hypothetical protein
MINALELLNLTQRSQSNAKEMSWDEREYFGLAQYAHKYVKCLREGAQSRPPSIYQRTPFEKSHWTFCVGDRRVCRTTDRRRARVCRTRSRHMSSSLQIPTVTRQTDRRVLCE